MGGPWARRHETSEKEADPARGADIVLDRQLAVRVDPETRSREEVRFFGPGRLKMFGCTHHPVGLPIGGVVICSPLQSEFLANYRREVLLARSLAARGFAVQRFHYRGTGNSDGDTCELTFETMRADAAAAAGWLSERTGITRLAFVGTRWGGVIAAAVAARTEGAPLVLWEPAVDGARYFREVFRTLQIRDLRDGSPTRPAEEIIRELQETGTLDVLGFSIDLPLYESSAGRKLFEEVASGPRAVLLIQVDRSERLRAEYADVVARWRSLGFTVETESVVGQDPWWFRGVWRQDHEMLRRGVVLARITTDWTVSRFEQAKAKS